MKRSAFPGGESFVAKQGRAVLCTVVVVFALVANGTVRNWTGGGDGVTFADSRNWDGAVQSGDSLVIENATADTTLALSNDLGSAESPFQLERIMAVGAGTVRIGGNPIEPIVLC